MLIIILSNNIVVVVDICLFLLALRLIFHNELMIS